MSKELAAIPTMTMAQLKQKFAELFGEPARSGNRAWLIKRVAWRMQSLKEGDLSERARKRAMELANDADLRLSPPRQKTLPMPAKVEAKKDDRLPPPGSTITKKYKGKELQVQILTTGFAYAGEVYQSLSAVAKAITGTHLNGFLFFGLKGGKR